MKKRVILAASIAAATCMPSPAADGPAVVYASNSGSSDIHVFSLDRRSGDLTLIETVAIPGVVKGGGSTPMAVSPDRRLLFVATRGEPQAVTTFAIDQKNGKLTAIGSGPLVDSMPFLSTDRTGRFLFAASYPGHKLTVSPIGANGVVGSTIQVLDGYPNAHSIQPDPQNRFVLAMTLGNDLLNVFKLDAKSGRLEPHTPPSARVKEKTGPRHFVFHPNGKLVYMLGELDAAVHVFDYDARRGALREKQAVSGLPTGGATGRIAAADLHVTPNGKFLYCSDRTTNSLTGFRVNGKDGTLERIENIPTEAMPRGFAIDSSGRYLFMAGMSSHRMSSYGIDAESGKLTKLKDYALGKSPNWIEIVDLR